MELRGEVKQNVIEEDNLYNTNGIRTRRHGVGERGLCLVSGSAADCSGQASFVYENLHLLLCTLE